MTSIKNDPRVHNNNRQDPKRARNSDGTLKADDPLTSDVNEAWEGGAAPVKKAKSRASNDAKKTSKS